MLGGCATSDSMNGNALSANAAPVQARATVEAEIPHTRLLPLEGGRNFRDLGGYKTTDGKEVKWGKLYRSGVLAHLTRGDYDYLQERDIATIVDFRSSSERENEPTRWAAGNVIAMNWDYEMGNWEQEFAKVLSKPGFGKEDLVKLMDQGYVGLVQQQTPHYRAMFQQMINPAEPPLFH